jgi:AbrB family looped-hinge helix DNA binding protein
MKTTVSSKGEIALPAELRQQDDIEAGEEFLVERIHGGEYRKGFFVPIESELTDDL